MRSAKLAEALDLKTTIVLLFVQLAKDPPTQPSDKEAIIRAMIQIEERVLARMSVLLAILKLAYR